MHWNYRIMRRMRLNPITHDFDETFGIYEVYYDEKGEPNGWSVNPEYVETETIEGIQWMAEKFQEALAKPVLEYKSKIPDTSMEAIQNDFIRNDLREQQDKSIIRDEVDNEILNDLRRMAKEDEQH